MEQYQNYKGFELSYYPNKMFKSGGDTIIDKNGWGVKGIFFQGKEEGLQLAKKYIDKNGEKKYVYMLNNTAMPSPRPFMAILESFQTEKGTVKIPQVLQKYTGFGEITKL